MKIIHTLPNNERTYLHGSLILRNSYVIEDSDHVDGSVHFS